MTEKDAERLRRPLAWGGFVDNKLDCGFRLGDRNDITPILAVFATRKMARTLYSDVRRVEIREVQ